MSNFPSATNFSSASTGRGAAFVEIKTALARANTQISIVFVASLAYGQIAQRQDPPQSGPFRLSPVGPGATARVTLAGRTSRLEQREIFLSQEKSRPPYCPIGS